MLTLKNSSSRNKFPTPLTIKTNIFYVFFIFLVFSLIGWIFETTAAAISQHKFIQKGYLFILEPLSYYFPSLDQVSFLENIPLIVGLPLIEIYGFGALISIFAFGKLRNRPVLLFLSGMVVLTAFELLGSYFCSYVLHKRFWDYSENFLNFQGRICLMSSLAWGVASLLIVKVLVPLINKAYIKIEHRRVLRIVVCILIILSALCALSKYWWFADVLT